MSNSNKTYLEIEQSASNPTLSWVASHNLLEVWRKVKSLSTGFEGKWKDLRQCCTYNCYAARNPKEISISLGYLAEAWEFDGWGVFRMEARYGKDDKDPNYLPMVAQAEMSIKDETLCPQFVVKTLEDFLAALQDPERESKVWGSPEGNEEHCRLVLEYLKDTVNFEPHDLICKLTCAFFEDVCSRNELPFVSVDRWLDEARLLGSKVPEAEQSQDGSQSQYGGAEDLMFVLHIAQHRGKGEGVGQ